MCICAVNVCVKLNVDDKCTYASLCENVCHTGTSDIVYTIMCIQLSADADIRTLVIQGSVDNLLWARMSDH